MLNLPHVASRVFGTPLLIARAKLEVILGVLGPRLSGGSLEPIDPEPDPQTSITVERIAVVSAIGTLVSRSGYLDAASGLLSYADIGEAIAAAMADPTVRGVALDVDSSGGEVGGLFDKLIGHSKVEEAYKYYTTTGQQPLREDTRRRFPFAGLVFEEYNAPVTLSTGVTETLIPANEGTAFPVGTTDTFVTYGAPANLIETVNTVGLPIYARQVARQRDRRENRGIAAAGQQAAPPRRQDLHQQLKVEAVDVFAVATDALFADPNLTRDAIWRAGGAGGRYRGPCRHATPGPGGRLRRQPGSVDDHAD